ncbi:secretory subunit, partial [Massospora cicadina]
MKYNYDESGVTFYYFLISVLGLILVPLTLRPLFASQRKPLTHLSFLWSPLLGIFSNDIRTFKRIRVVTRGSGSNALKWALIALGWGILSIGTYHVWTTQVPDAKLWDPYSILDIVEVDGRWGFFAAVLVWVEANVSPRAHPDKIRGKTDEERGALNEKYVEITKAYKASRWGLTYVCSLTDEDIRKNYEEFGHPDGRQSLSLGIALPAWLVEAHNNVWVLGVYGLVLGLFMPLYVVSPIPRLGLTWKGKWWYRSNKYTRDQILNQTMAIYFQQLKENMPMRDLIELLAASGEFKHEVHVKEEDEQKCMKLWASIKSAAEKDAMIVEEPRNVSQAPTLALALIMAHLLRLPIEDPSLLQDQQAMVQRAVGLIHGLMQITMAQNWIHTSIMCIDLSQMIVQAMPYKSSPLLQLPHITHETVRHMRGRRRNLKNVYELMKLDEAERRALLSPLSDEQYRETVQAGLQFPVLKLTKVTLRVLDDNAITPNAIVTCVLKLKLVTLEQELADAGTAPSLTTDTQVRSFLSKASQSHLVPPAYAPYFPGVMGLGSLTLQDKRANWWILLGDLRNGRMLANPSKVTDLANETTVKFQFQGPPEEGEFSFNLFIKSDSYLGLDLRQALSFTVEPVSVLPEESEVEDDISEPESGSLAGQMAQMRSGEEAPSAPWGMMRPRATR